MLFVELSFAVAVIPDSKGVLEQLKEHFEGRIEFASCAGGNR